MPCPPHGAVHRRLSEGGQGRFVLPVLLRLSEGPCDLSRRVRLHQRRALQVGGGARGGRFRRSLSHSRHRFPRSRTHRRRSFQVDRGQRSLGQGDAYRRVDGLHARSQRLRPYPRGGDGFHLPREERGPEGFGEHPRPVADGQGLEGGEGRARRIRGINGPRGDLRSGSRVVREGPGGIRGCGVQHHRLSGDVLRAEGMVRVDRDPLDSIREGGARGIRCGRCVDRCDSGGHRKGPFRPQEGGGPVQGSSLRQVRRDTLQRPPHQRSDVLRRRDGVGDQTAH